MELKGSRVLVVGLGVSGFSAARALAEHGADVVVTEAGKSSALQERAAELEALGVRVELGGHERARDDVELAVVSPGIAPTSDVLRTLTSRGVRLVGEVELAWELAKCSFIAVTGTNGKTTTTQLIEAMLHEAGVPSLAAGNIGLPLIDAIARVPSGGVVALEVSSFQLALTESFRPDVAVVLNIAEDHTDWHGSVEEYARAKARITVNQSADDVLVVNAEDERVMEIAESSRARVVPFSWRALPESGVGMRDAQITWRDMPIFPYEDVAAGGAALLEDALAATAAVLEWGVDPAAVGRALKGFRPLPHRMQTVGRSGDVIFIDDSKATNPHATLTAVRGLRDVVLIAGGRSKGIDLSPLAAAVPPVRAAVALGEAADDVHDVLSPLVPVERVGDMEQAVTAAHAFARSGGVVLLSPACASLDMYESYAARGDDFARHVRALIDDDVKGDQDGNA